MFTLCVNVVYICAEKLAENSFRKWQNYDAKMEFFSFHFLYLAKLLLLSMALLVTMLGFSVAIVMIFGGGDSFQKQPKKNWRSNTKLEKKRNK